MSTTDLEQLALDFASGAPSDRRSELADAIRELVRRARMTDLEKRVEAGEAFPTVNEVFSGLADKHGFELS